MKLTEEQVKEIENYLVKDNIFYEDVRLEMVDHIASHLEETLSEHDDFHTALKQYMNSHHKVKLLTAARAQEKVKDRHYRDYFLKQYIQPKGALLFVLLLLGIYLGTISGMWMYRICEACFMILCLWFISGLRGVKSPFIRRIKEEIQIYYLAPILIISQSKRYFEDSAILFFIEITAYTCMFVSCYFIYLTNKNYKQNRHA